MTDHAALLPGATIGIFGGGQLGQMLAAEAGRLGYKTCVLDPSPDCPARRVADELIVAPFSDTAAARQLAQASDVLTYEFENVDVEAVSVAARETAIYPSADVLRIIQNRRRQKDALLELGVPIAPFRSVNSQQDLITALHEVGVPAVLKAATSGYDGKGQAVITDATQAAEAFDSVGYCPDGMVLEEFIRFEREVSAVCARTAGGEVKIFPVVENTHKDGILHMTIAPAPESEHLTAEALRLVSAIGEGLDIVGLYCVEMFECEGGKLLVNEIAPRPHNSGHFSLDACTPSQYEQLVRVLCGLPLLQPEMHASAVMVNLLGDVWGDGSNTVSALQVPGVHLHVYGKSDARPKRKMGHLTALAGTPDEALKRAERAFNLIIENVV